MFLPVLLESALHLPSQIQIYMFDDEIFIRYLMYIDQLFSTGYTVPKKGVSGLRCLISQSGGANPSMIPSATRRPSTAADMMPPA